MQFNGHWRGFDASSESTLGQVLFSGAAARGEARLFSTARIRLAARGLFWVRREPRPTCKLNNHGHTLENGAPLRNQRPVSLAR